MANQVEKLLVTQFCDLINVNKTEIELPEYVTIGAPRDTKGCALWFQILPSSTERKYIRGKTEHIINLALYYRQNESDLHGVEAKMVIPSENISDWLDNAKIELPDFKIKEAIQTKSAAIFSRGNDGVIIYQSFFSVAGSRK